MKHKWKKEEKELYSPSTMPTIINVRKQKYFMISGKGNPNGEEFSEKIGVLYSLAYAVRMMPKGGYTPDGYFEYTVYPLEGVWDLTENGKNSDTFNKEELLYTIMIRQPDFVTEQVAKRAFEIVQKKKPHPFLSDAKFAEMEDGTCVQILHIGPFDDEPQSFAKIKDFINQNGLKREILTHREIYLSDFRKTEQQKLKTILRYFVKKL